MSDFDLRDIIPKELFVVNDFYSILILAAFFGLSVVLVRLMDRLTENQP